MSIDDEIKRINKLYDVMPNRIPLEYVQYYQGRPSTFIEYLHTLFPSDKVSELMEMYQLGGLPDGRTIFWQIDYLCQCRSGKIIDYGIDGHRKKDGKTEGATWCHYYLRKNGKLPRDFTLEQCMFGEHLLHIHPFRTIAVVEAEKTAILCAAIYPEYIWLAVGGKYNFNIDKCKALCLRKVIVFPDTDDDGSTFRLWQKQASTMRFLCRSIVVSDILERCATSEEKSRKIDIADLLLKDYAGDHWTEQPPYKDIIRKAMTIVEANQPL